MRRIVTHQEIENLALDNRVFSVLKRKCERQERRIKQLEEVLIKLRWTGCHDEWCDSRNGGKCDCGKVQTNRMIGRVMKSTDGSRNGSVSQTNSRT
jgi:hypothetical protein